ncbi:MAG: glycosyltransferase family 9 protein, partial [Steroidobacteraceae bacterium]
MVSEDPSRVLIFRPGSVGDTMVCLPCFHLIARRFPNAERRVLTNSPVSKVSVSVKAVLDGTGLVDDYFEVDRSDVRSRLRSRWDLCRRIRSWRPELLIVLTDPRGFKQHFSELAFFKLCGVRAMLNMSFAERAARHRWVPERGRYEYEAARLARLVRSVGDARLDDSASWDLRLSSTERERALEAVKPARGTAGLIVCSVGVADPIKDWGVENWLAMVKKLAVKAGGYGLALVGAASEYDRSEAVRKRWHGPSANLCGRLSIRETAAVMEHADVYLGHDSGPMHLAAAAGIHCVAIFTARQHAGTWFPYGNQHRVIFHDVPCAGCNLSECTVHAKRCITSITVAEVLGAVEDLLFRGGASFGTTGNASIAS